MKKIILIVLFFISSNALAEPPMMRLFYSPAERAKIDASRQAPIKNTANNTQSKPRTEIIKVKGYLKRKGKSDVVWINDKNTLASNKPIAGVKVLKVENKGKVSLIVNDIGRVKVQPGKVLSVNPHIIIDAYEISK